MLFFIKHIFTYTKILKRLLISRNDVANFVTFLIMLFPTSFGTILKCDIDRLLLGFKNLVVLILPNCNLMMHLQIMDRWSCTLLNKLYGRYTVV